MAKSVWTSSPTQLLRADAGFSLADVAPDSTPGFDGGKKAGVAALEAGREPLRDLQERLWAESRFGGTRSLLLVIQAMDTAGKGGIVEHVTGGITPEGLAVVRVQEAHAGGARARLPLAGAQAAAGCRVRGACSTAATTRTC